MSWYVEVLLLNRDLIRAKEDISSDEYNDLIQVESILEELLSSKSISEKELEIFNCVLTTPNFFEADNQIDVTRKTISKTFRKVCNRISYRLGSYFTDDGYLSQLAYKHKLSDIQLEKVREYMNSEYRYRIANKIYEED